MLTLLYQVFAVLCGWLEAILYNKRAAESFSYNEHVGMTFQRIAAALMPVASVILYHLTGQFWVLLELIPAALLFPASHDEAYNFTRLWLTQRATMADDYEKADSISWKLAVRQYKYGYQSPTTTARNDFSGKQRTWLAAAGILFLVTLYFFLFFR